MRPILSVLSALAWLAIGCSAGDSGDDRGASPGAGVAPPAILLITIDTLRPDHLGIYGYARDTSPHIDRFFGSGAVYERAYATDARTPPSAASILTGRLPSEHRVRAFYQRIPEHVSTIPDLLPATFQKAAFVGNSVLADEALGIGARFDHYEDTVDEAAIYRRTPERTAAPLTDAALRWLREQRDPARPLFLWVHYMDPHSPYRAPSVSLRGYSHDEPRLVPVENLAPNNIQREEAGEATRVDGLISVDAYDEEIAHTDAQIGRLLEGYAALAPIDDALVLLTADHGEGMIEHEMFFAHGYHVYEPVIRVPLLVRGPGVPRARPAGLASTIDVLPTLLGHVGRSAPPGLGGIDLRAGRDLDPQRVVYAGTTFFEGHWYAAMQGASKWVARLDPATGRFAERRHYDLAQDPDELAPGAWAPDQAAAGELERHVSADPDRVQRHGPAPDGKKQLPRHVAPGVTGEQLENLRALGYVD